MGIQAGVLFIGTVREQERKFLKKLLQGAKREGYERIVEPCCGSFALSRLALESGFKPEQIDTSDVSLFSAVLGRHIDGKDCKDLNVKAIGFDDKDMVAEIAKLITEVDDMIESYLENSKIEVQNIDVGSLLYPSMETDWKEISFMFLPAQFKRFADMVKDVGRKDAAYLIEEEKFKPFIEALGSFQKYQDIHSAGMAIDFLVRVANESLEEVGYNDNWQPIQSCVGGGSLPKKGAEIIRRAVKKMKKENVVPEKKPWMAIVKLCAEYLGEDCAGVC